MRFERPPPTRFPEPSAIPVEPRLEAIPALSLVVPTRDRSSLAARLVDALRTARRAPATAGVRVELREEKKSHIALVTARGEWVPLVLNWIARN